MRAQIPPVTYEIPSECQCKFCGELTLAFQLNCQQCGKPELRIDIGTFNQAVFDKQIIDIRLGGLVLGRASSEDDIPMFSFATKNVLCLSGMMQGMEYILSQEATTRHHARLKEINSEKGDAASLPQPNTVVFGSVFDTNLGKKIINPFDDSETPKSAGVWVDNGQMIINRFATKKHLEELIELNKDY